MNDSAGHDEHGERRRPEPVRVASPGRPGREGCNRTLNTVKLALSKYNLLFFILAASVAGASSGGRAETFAGVASGVSNVSVSNVSMTVWNYTIQKRG
jgi:hypothetical protein